jgi:hypothetical protein
MYKYLIITLAFTVGISFTHANPMRPDPITTQQPTVKSGNTKPIVRKPKLPVLINIVIIGDYKKAIFRGNEEIREGDLILGYQLSEVSKDYVVLKRGQRLTRINLKTPGEFSVTPADEE